MALSREPSAAKQTDVADGTSSDNDQVVFVELRCRRLAPGVVAQPDVLLRAWRIFEAYSGARYLCGFLEGTDTVRFTSPIMTIDPISRRITTGSGRIYHLHSAPTVDRILLLAMSLHAGAQGLSSLVDSSDSAWKMMARATQ